MEGEGERRRRIWLSWVWSLLWQFVNRYEDVESVGENKCGRENGRE